MGLCKVLSDCSKSPSKSARLEGDFASCDRQARVGHVCSKWVKWIRRVASFLPGPPRAKSPSNSIDFEGDLGEVDAG